MPSLPPGIYQRANGNYQVRLRIDGKLQSFGAYKTQREAKQALAKARLSVLAPSTDMTLAQYAERWAQRRHDKAPKTRQHNETMLRLYILPRLGNRPLGKISRSDIADWHAAVKLDAALRANKRGTGEATAAHAYRVLRQILNEALRDDLIVKNPASLKGAGTNHAPERVPPTPDQVRALAAAMPDRWACAVTLACWAALRRGEVLGLQRQDIDLSAGAIRISRASVQQTGGMAIRPVKTRASARTVHIPHNVVEAVRAHLEAHVGPNPNDWLFTSATGQLVDGSSFERSWRIARQKVAVVGVHFHDLRHAGLTEAARAGATTRALMARAGHVTPEMSIRYQHAVASDDRAIADRLGHISAPPDRT